jgi:hypothetical protein
MGLDYISDLLDRGPESFAVLAEFIPEPDKEILVWP